MNVCCVYFSLFDCRFVFYLFQMSMKRSQWCLEGNDEHKKWFYLDKIFVSFALERYVKRRDDQITAIVRQTHTHTCTANSNRFKLIIAIAFVLWDALCHRFWNWMLSEWSQKCVSVPVLVSIKKEHFKWLCVYFCSSLTFYPCEKGEWSMFSAVVFLIHRLLISTSTKINTVSSFKRTRNGNDFIWRWSGVVPLQQQHRPQQHKQ